MAKIFLFVWNCIHFMTYDIEIKKHALNEVSFKSWIVNPVFEILYKTRAFIIA